MTSNLPVTLLLKAASDKLYGDQFHLQMDPGLSTFATTSIFSQL